MADNKQQTIEQFSNEILKEVFQDLHSSVVRTINASSVIDKLFEARVISDEDINDLDHINHRTDKCRRLLIVLRNTKHPRAFIELRQAINDEYEFLVKDVDERYKLKAALTPLNGDTGDGTEKNRAIDSVVIQKVTKLDEATGVSETGKESTLDDPQKTSRDNDVLLKRPLHHNPQLLSTLDQPPTHNDGRPRLVYGVVTLDKYLYVVYCKYNKVEVFDCEHRFKKIKDIEVKQMKEPRDMVGSSLTSQLFISEMKSDVIWRLDLKTGVSDVLVKTGYTNKSLSLVENRLLVTSRDSLLMFDIVSGERIKKIPLTEDIKKYYVDHAIESNRDSFFVCHRQSNNNTVSEIDSESRVIRVFDNKQQLLCDHLALDSVGRLLVIDGKNNQVVLFDEHLKYKRILIDNKRLDNESPWRLNYNKNNNRLTVGLYNGHVKIFEY